MFDGVKEKLNLKLAKAPGCSGIWNVVLWYESMRERRATALRRRDFIAALVIGVTRVRFTGHWNLDILVSWL